VRLFNELNPNAVLFLREVNNPSRYGIAVVRDEGSFNNFRLVRVLDVEEKPRNPRSNIAISAVYIFNEKIFNSLENVKTEGELELTYGIKNLIDSGGEVYGLILDRNSWLSVGDPESYIETINRMFNSYGKN